MIKKHLLKTLLTSNRIVLILFISSFFQTISFAKEIANNKGTNSSLLKFGRDSILKKKIIEADKIYKEKKFDLALKKSFLILDSLKEEDKESKLKINFLIGNIFYETLSYKEGIKYFKKNIDLISNEVLFDLKTNVLDSVKDVLYSKSLLRLGSSYHKLKERDKSNVYKDSTIYFYNKVINFKNLNSSILDVKAVAYSNLSALYINDSLYDKAEIYASKSIEIHKSKNNRLSYAGAIGNLASIYLIQEDYIKAKKLYLKGIELIKNNNSSKADRFKASLYLNLSWAMYNLKDYKAYEFQEISFDIKDELRESEFREIVKKINAVHNVDVAKKSVRQEEENKRLKAQRGFWIAGIIALIIIISLVYWLNFYNLKQKNLALELSQTELIQNKNLDKLKSESQIRILNATIDGKESERKQIAETLHDSVSALLSSANLHLQATRKQFNGSTPIEIHKTQEIILEASHKVRDLSHTLVSSVLLKFGLDFAIRDISEKYSNSVLNIETEINDIGRYHQGFEIKVYNIVQEFINNILKHSKANNALIELKEEDKKLFLTISDDGLGFDKTKINMKDGLGINQIDARIQMMKGMFFIESSFNNGTKISVELPILEKEEISHV